MSYRGAYGGSIKGVSPADELLLDHVTYDAGGDDVLVDVDFVAAAIHGSTASTGNLTISSTTNASKGDIFFGSSVYREGTNRMGIGTATPNNSFHVKTGTSSAISNIFALAQLENSGTTYLQFLTPNSATAGIIFGDPEDADAGGVLYNHNQGRLRLITEGQVRIEGTGTTVLTLKDTDGAGDAANLSIDFTDSGDIVQAQIATAASSDDLNIKCIAGAVKLFANSVKKLELTDSGQCEIPGADGTGVKIIIGDSATTADCLISFRDVDGATTRRFGWDNSSSEFQAEDNLGVMQSLGGGGGAFLPLTGGTLTGSLTIEDVGANILTLKDTDGAGDAASLALRFVDSGGTVQANITTEAGADDLQIKSQTGAIELYAANVLRLEIQDAGKCFIVGEINEGDKLNLGDSSQGGNAFLACFDKAVGVYRSIGWDNTANEMQLEATGGGRSTIVTASNLATQISTQGVTGPLTIADAGVTVLTIKDTDGAGNAASVAIEFVDSGDVEQAVIKTSASNNDLQVRSTTGAVKLFANNTNKLEVADSGQCTIHGADTTTVKLVLGDASTSNDCLMSFRDTGSATQRGFGWDNGDSKFVMEDDTSTLQTVVHAGNITDQIRVDYAGGGTNNVALGLNALDSTTNNSNVAIGSGAMENSTSPSCMTAVGKDALNANVTGNSNTAIGCNSMADSTSSNNCAVGVNTLKLATGGQNTAIGKSAGDVVGSGSENTFLGNNAGGLVTTGSNNICIGNNVDTSAVGASNETIVGNSSTTSTEVFGVFTATGDGMVFPSFTTTNRDAITGMVAGQVIYNTTTSVLNFYNGSAWAAV